MAKDGAQGFGEALLYAQPDVQLTKSWRQVLILYGDFPRTAVCSGSSQVIFLFLRLMLNVGLRLYLANRAWMSMLCCVFKVQKRLSNLSHALMALTLTNLVRVGLF